MMARSFGLGKLDDRRVFLSLIHLAGIGILKVEGDTSLGWIDLSIAVEDLLSVVPRPGKTIPGGSRMTSPIETIPAPPGLARDPLSEVWGDLSDADSAGLLADVRAHGVRQPILVDLDKGTVVDGWHGYRMAALAGGECPAIDVASWPAAEVEAAVQSSNRHRRHSSRKELLGAMARQRAERGSGPAPNRGAGSPLCRGYETPVSAGASGDKGRPGAGPRPTAGEGRRPPPSRGTPRPLTWTACWSFRRIPSRRSSGPPLA